MLQTSLGKDRLAKTVAQLASRPDSRLSIEGLGGVVPFDMTIERIAFSDAGGTWLTLSNGRAVLSPAALLAGRVQVRSLTIGAIAMARPPNGKSATPAIDYLHAPRLPVAVSIEEASIGRLALAAPVLGEPLVATLSGTARTAGETAHVALDLHRIDGQAGSLAVALELAGAPPILTLRIDASEPSGMLLGRLLGRGDHPSLALSVNGNGPLADWHGQIRAAAGPLAHIDADLSLAVAGGTSLGLSGTARIAPLLPPTLSPILGDEIRFALHAAKDDRHTALDRLAIDLAAGRLTGTADLTGSADQSGSAIAADLHAEVPQLASLSGILGVAAQGSANLAVTVSGTERRPALKAELSAAGIRVAGAGAGHVAATVSATPNGDLDDPHSPIDIAGTGRVEKLVMPDRAALPPGLGNDFDWSLAATAARDASRVELIRLAAHGIGISVAGAGHMADGGRQIDGRLNLSIADLRLFSALAGRPIAGSVKLDIDAERQGAAGFKARLDGATEGLQTGNAVADALLGRTATATGSLSRDPAGVLILDRAAIAGAAAKLSVAGRFDPGSKLVQADATVDVPQLRPLGAALGDAFAGRVTGRLSADGRLDRLRLKGEVEGSDLAAGGARLDRLRLDARVADLSQPKAQVDGNFRAARLDGTLTLRAEPDGGAGLSVPQFRLSAAGGTLEGKLRIARDSGLVEGSITGHLPDLARWSTLAGTALGGALDIAAGLDARDGQRLDLKMTGTRLAVGAGASRVAIGRVEATAKLADLRRRPSGNGRIVSTAVQFPGGNFATATLNIDGLRPGRFAVQANVAGRPLTMALAGEGGIEPAGSGAPGVGFRLDRLAGSLGNERIRLLQPLSLSRRGADFTVSGLALGFGSGRIDGNGSLRGPALALTLNVADLPLAEGARLLGFRGLKGELNVSATAGGTIGAPRGRIVANARNLAFALPSQARAAGLGLALTGDWNGRTIALDGRATGLKGDAIGLTGTLPLVLNRTPFGISVPRRDPLALRVRGAGELGHLADLLPLGEDRLTGPFSADLAVGGIVAAPVASGHLKLAGARYQNFATGAVLTDIDADLAGDRDRLSLASFSAADGAGGKIAARGSIALSGADGPVADLAASLTDFRVAARDEAVVTASGKISIAGPLAGPRIAAPLTIDHAEINLPTSLPANVVVLEVTRIDSKTGQPRQPQLQSSAKPASATPAAAPFAAMLNIRLDLPGQVFVRGHGLDSEWRGRLTITGTSAAPRIAGNLSAIRGSVNLLGKTFRLTTGRITFDGTGNPDPVLDIVAEIATADVTAQIRIGGVASAPKIKLSSIPALPQDEILSRVLFGQGVGQINAAQGLQLAQAAAALTGNDLGVLGRLRGGLGLDWLGFGSGPQGAAPSIVNPSLASTSATNGTSFSAGKYIAQGVSVGVTQGISPPTSKVTVEIQLGRHLTVDTEAGQNSGTGIGLNYHYDY